MILAVPITAIAIAADASGLSAAQAQAPSSPAPRTSSGWHHFGERAPATPAASGAAAPASLASLEREMGELINRDRAQNHSSTGDRLPPLRWNNELAAVARAHSRDMVARGYFGHVDPGGRSPGARVQAAGLSWQAVGENIAMDVDVRSAEAAFMNEPRSGMNHRSNILSSKFTEVGVGIVTGPNGNLYITQEFMKPAASLESAFSPR